MRVKTSITIARELIEAVDEWARQEHRNRSDVIEAAVRAFIEQRSRIERDARDLAILNRRAESLNQEAADVLEYQVPP